MIALGQERGGYYEETMQWLWSLVGPDDTVYVDLRQLRDRGPVNAGKVVRPPVPADGNVDEIDVRERELLAWGDWAADALEQTTVESLAIVESRGFALVMLGCAAGVHRAPCATIKFARSMRRRFDSHGIKIDIRVFLPSFMDSTEHCSMRTSLTSAVDSLLGPRDFPYLPVVRQGQRFGVIRKATLTRRSAFGLVYCPVVGSANVVVEKYFFHLDEQFRWVHPEDFRLLKSLMIGMPVYFTVNPNEPGRVQRESLRSAFGEWINLREPSIHKP